MYCHPSLANPPEAAKFLLDHVPCPPPYLNPKTFLEIIEEQELSECKEYLIRKCRIGKVEPDVTYVTRPITADIRTTVSNVSSRSTTTEPIGNKIIDVDNAGVNSDVIAILIITLTIIVVVCIVIMYLFKRGRIQKGHYNSCDIPVESSWKDDSNTMSQYKLFRKSREKMKPQVLQQNSQTPLKCDIIRIDDEDDPYPDIPFIDVQIKLRSRSVNSATELELTEKILLHKLNSAEDVHSTMYQSRHDPC